MIRELNLLSLSGVRRTAGGGGGGLLMTRPCSAEEEARKRKMVGWRFGVLMGRGERVRRQRGQWTSSDTGGVAERSNHTLRLELRDSEAILVELVEGGRHRRRWRQRALDNRAMLGQGGGMESDDGRPEGSMVVGARVLREPGRG